jgi:hypothetical protein
MTTYPIVLKAQSQPQGVSHTFTIQEGNTESIDGFEHISIWLKNQDQWSTSATYTCQVCGAILDIPDGSLRAHLKKYQEEHAGKDAIVRAAYTHTGPGSDSHLRARIITDKTRIRSIKESVEMQENSNQNSDNNV